MYVLNSISGADVWSEDFQKQIEIAKRRKTAGVCEAGLNCLNEHRLVLVLILFLAGVNLVASAFDAVLPAFILPRENGGERVLGIVTSFGGIAMLAGSLLVSVLPAPKRQDPSHCGYNDDIPDYG